jgi:sulfate adenylyltransferase subunit 1
MTPHSDLIAENIHEYLDRHERKDLLRFITCGSVDDGKSTLIGRLLHDSKQIYEDQFAAIQRDSRRYNTTEDDVDLALLVDGLQAEREQGITIDVAYRYFSTERRKYIIADCPGHEQYTRNMATGASTCDVAVILVDAVQGVRTQTRRHSFIVSQLGVRQVIVAVNKMDLQGYDKAVFEAIRSQYLTLMTHLDFESVHFVPISALRGENVVAPGDSMPWYQGETLLQLLDSLEVSRKGSQGAFRFPVQFVNRPNAGFRGFSGSIAAGEIRPGDRVQALPSGRQSRVKEIVTADGSLSVARLGQAVTLTLQDEIDISRGDMLVKADEAPPHISAAFDARIVWMSTDALHLDQPYLFKLAGRLVPGRVEQFAHRIDINSYETLPAESLSLNEIGSSRVVLDAPAIFDAYRQCRHTGGFIVVDPQSNATVGCGMIEAAASSPGAVEAAAGLSAEARLAAFERELNAMVRKHFPHWGAKEVL